RRKALLAAGAGVRPDRRGCLAPASEDVARRSEPAEPAEEPEHDHVQLSPYAPATASVSIPSFSSACRAASCSAAFFERPVPMPTCSPSIVAAQVKLRSCGGPSTSTTA